MRENEKRQKQIYTFDELPIKLRNQIVLILKETLGEYTIENNYDVYSSLRSTEIRTNEFWDAIYNLFCREKGILKTTSAGSTMEQCLQIIIYGSFEDAMDITELSLRLIEKAIGESDHHQHNGYNNSEEAIEEINDRFKENSIGYQYIERMFIKIDSELIYEEITTPAFKVLRDDEYEGALNELIGAYENFKSGKFKESIVSAENAFESTLKTACYRRGLNLKNTETANELINSVIKLGLISANEKDHLDALRKTLIYGLPRVRNNNGGHGDGETTKNIPEYMAKYALNLTATNINLIISAEKRRE